MTYNSGLTNNQLRETPVQITEADKLILAELRVISFLLTVGLNVNEDIDKLRDDILDDL